MKQEAKIILIIILLIFQALYANAEVKFSAEDSDIAKIMKANKIEGTMLLVSANNKEQHIFNHKRANARLSPASTFKIPNSIIALETGVLKNQHQIIKWDGEKRFLDVWNKDQNLKSAFKASCVWFYQELALRIGKDNYKKYLRLLDYGNQDTGKDITNFWLSHELLITPIEQLQFLQKLHHQQFKISPKTYEILKDIMLEEETESYKLYSKTGAATKDWVGHGWYVGYIVTKDQTWYFVTNIMINSMDDLSKRKNVTMQILKKKKII